MFIVADLVSLKGQSRLQQTTNLAASFLVFEENKVQVDISWESSTSRRFSWNIEHTLLLFLKKQQNLKLSSAANYIWFVTS